MKQFNPSESDAVAGCGNRLRLAREAAGLGREEVASRLKMPVRVVESLEKEDWDVLGAPIYVRGQLRSYARLLKVDDLDIDACVAAGLAPVAPPELVSHTHTPRYRRVLEQAGRRAVYIVLTLAIAVPAWFATTPHLGRKAPDTQSLEVPADLALPDAGSDADMARPTAPAPRRTPVVASITPRPAADAVDAGLVLSFNDESWVELFDAEGNAIEKGLLAAGEERRFDAGRVASVKLGNAAAVDVRAGGETVDLEPFSRGTVARFKLSSDGSVVPASE